MSALTEYLARAVEAGASDLFLIPGSPLSCKLEGKLMPLAQERLMPDETDVLISEIFSLAGRDMLPFRQSGDDDFSFAVPGLARFRVNTYRQRGSLAAVIRVVAFSVPDWEKLRIPAQVMELSRLSSGMVLFTGTAGCGKSTTQACLVDRINHRRACHIITLEDPIEYLHRNRMSIVSQREIALDTCDYPSALRACLRQAPDVIQLGEMRDLETIRTAMTAAETGHLLLATLHTRGAVNTIDRIIDTFPGAQQEQIRQQVAASLEAVVSQRLLKRVGGGRVAAFEVMSVNSGIRNLIREAKTFQIDNIIQTTASEGNMLIETSLYDLVSRNMITREDALKTAFRPGQMSRMLGGA